VVAQRAIPPFPRVREAGKNLLVDRVHVDHGYTQTSETRIGDGSHCTTSGSSASNGLVNIDAKRPQVIEQ